MTSPKLPREGDRKFDVLCAVHEHWKDARHGPTLEEIRDTVGLGSRSTVQFHINDLLSDGYLDHVPGKRRTLKTTKRGDLLIKIVKES